jgi:hypothetical protein
MDVYTTVSLQHLESLNDVVAGDPLRRSGMIDVSVISGNDGDAAPPLHEQ